MESMSASTGFQKSFLIPKQLLPMIKPRCFTAKTAETQESVLVSVQKKKNVVKKILVFSVFSQSMVLKI